GVVGSVLAVRIMGLSALGIPAAVWDDVYLFSAASTAARPSNDRHPAQPHRSADLWSSANNGLAKATVRFARPAKRNRTERRAAGTSVFHLLGFLPHVNSLDGDGHRLAVLRQPSAHSANGATRICRVPYLRMAPTSPTNALVFPAQSDEGRSHRSGPTRPT